MWKVEYFNSYHWSWESLGESARKSMAQTAFVEWKFRFPDIKLRVSKIEKENKNEDR